MELCAGSHKEITAELVNEILGTSSYEKMCQVAKSIAEKNYASLFATINEVVCSSKDILVFFGDLTSFYRDMMVQKSSGDASYLELLPSEAKLLAETASLFNMATLIHHTSLLDDAYTSMMRNPAGKRLCAEVTLMKMCDPKLNDSTDALLSRITTLEDKLTLLTKNGVAVISEQNQSIDVTPVEKTEEEKEEVQKEISSEDNTSYGSLFVDNWDDIIAKAGQKDPAVGSFLKSCQPAYSKKSDKYYIFSTNGMFVTMLNRENNKKVVYDAMVCCEIEISSISQLEIVQKNIKAQASDLDEF